MARIITGTLTILGLAAVAAATTPDFARLREATQRHPDVAKAIAESRALLEDAKLLSHHDTSFSRVFEALQGVRLDANVSVSAGGNVSDGNGSTGGSGSASGSGSAEADAGNNGNGNGGLNGQAACRSLLQVSAMAAVNASCPHIHTIGIGAVFDVNNGTSVAVEAAASMCAPGCTAAIEALVRAEPQCFTGNGRLYKLLPRMCTMYDGMPCAVRLRKLPKTECDAFNHNQTGCSSADRWCAYNTLNGACEFKSTAARLEQICTPCLEQYINVIVDTLELLAPALSTNDGRDKQKKLWQFTRQSLLNQKLFWCGKVDDQWCHLTYSAVDERAFNISHNNNMSLADVQQNLTNTCTVSGWRCLNKAVGAVVNIMIDTAEYAAWNCKREQCSNSVLSSLQSCSGRNRRCANAYASVSASATLSANLADFVCSRNADSVICGNVLHGYARQDCWVTLSTTCNAACAAWLTNFSATAGCCIDNYHSVTSSAFAFETVPGYLRAELNATAIRLAGLKTPDSHPLNAWNVRCAASVSSFNATQVTVNTLPCAKAPAVRKALQLRGVRWSKLRANATLRASLEQALRADCARTMGVSSEAIVNGTITADTTQSLTVSTSSRQQQAQATAGAKFEFALVVSTEAAASAAASTFDTAVNSGSIEVASTATVLAEDCSDCLGSPTAAPGSTPAPPPTGPNAFNNVAGSTSAEAGQASSSTAASAAGVAVSFALLVAVAVLA